MKINKKHFKLKITISLFLIFLLIFLILLVYFTQTYQEYKQAHLEEFTDSFNRCLQHKDTFSEHINSPKIKKEHYDCFEKGGCYTYCGSCGKIPTKHYSFKLFLEDYLKSDDFKACNLNCVEGCIYPLD